MNRLLRLASTIGLLASVAIGSLAFAADVKAPDTPPPASTPPQPKPVNVNTATRPELEKLPGIGRVLAERIIAARPYKSVDDLKKVEGMGEKTFAMVKPLVTVE
jgi:competence ComEA-like helix-hairpin-helix protein